MNLKDIVKVFTSCWRQSLFTNEKTFFNKQMVVIEDSTKIV